MANFNVRSDAPTCSCGVKFERHKSGRCMDAILHRLAYHEIPQMYPAGTVHTDGLRDIPLFQEDLLVERDGEKYLVPCYSSDPAQTMILYSKWHDVGGTGHLNMNRSGWSATFSHGTALRSYYSGHMTRSRLEWLAGRALGRVLIIFNRQSQVDDCTWIDGVDPVST